MPKEAFYTWSGPEPHRKIFELRWAKETDVDPAKTVIYLPPLPEETPDGVLEMIGNGGDVAEIDRLIAALKRAKRAMLGTTSGVDEFTAGFVNSDAWRKANGFSAQAPEERQDQPIGKFHVGQKVKAIQQALPTTPVIPTEVIPAEREVTVFNVTGGVLQFEGLEGNYWDFQFVPVKELEHNPTDICPVPGCNCDLDFRAAQRPGSFDGWDAKDAVQEEIAREQGWISGIPSHALLSYTIAGNRLVTAEDEQAARRVAALLEK